MRKVVGTVCGLIGIGLVVGGRIYHFALHPEWTQAQALREMSVQWGIGIVFLVVALWLRRK